MMKFFQNFENVVSFVIVRAIKAKKSRLASTSRGNISSVKIQPLQLKNVLPHIIFGFGVLLTGAFLLFEAKEFVEFSDTFYPFATVLSNFIIVSLVVRNGEKLFKLIDHLECIVEKRNLEKITTESHTLIKLN